MYQSAGTDGVVDDAVAPAFALLVVALDVSAAAVVDIACVGADAASVVVAAAQPAGSEVPLAVATGADVDTDEDDAVDDTFDDLVSVEPESVSRDRYATMSLPTATTLTTSQPSAAFEVSDVANAA